MPPRKSQHAFHDLNADKQTAEPMDPVDVPEMAEINRRIANLHTSAAITRSSPVPASKYLVDQIPGPQLPLTLSIGGQAREPVPEIPSERVLAQAAVDGGNGGEFRTFQDACPPPADAQYSIIDQGMSGPNFLRLSMYNVPFSSKLRESSQLPLALLARPFAEAEVPLADFSMFNSSEMPPRCVRCRAYMNPSMIFSDGGMKFTCNLCLFVNHTPSEYFQPLDVDGKRADWKERPELAFGTYEFEVAPPTVPEEVSGLGDGHDTHGVGLVPEPSIYGSSSPPLKHVFSCECTREAIQKGALLAFTSSIREAVPLMAKGTSFSIMLFDSKAYYFRKMKHSRSQMLVVTPGSRAVVPPDVFYSPETDGDAIESLLELIPNLFTGKASQNQCFGTALETALEAVGAAGRVSAVLCTLPSSSPAQLTPRDSSIAGVTPVDTPVNHRLFAQTSKFYVQLAERAKDTGTAIDLIALPAGTYLDLASLCPLTQKTGGKLLHYPRFSLQRDTRRFIADFIGLVEVPQARSASLRLRCSTGLQVKLVSEYASGQKSLDEQTRDVYMDADSTVIAEVHHDSNLDPKLDAHFQAAVLYTAPDGSKRVRILNLLAGVATKMKSLLKFVDIDVVLAILTRQTLAQIDQHESSDLRTAVKQKVMDIFGAARLHAGQGMPLTQLLMPTNLRELIMMGLSLTKSISIGYRGYSVDSRVANAVYLSNATPEQLSLSLYPRIHDLAEFSTSTSSTLTRGLRARFPDLLLGSQAHLIFDGQQLYLWLGTNVSTQLLQDLFGVSSLEDVSPWIDEIPALDTDLNRRTRELCGLLAAKTGLGWSQLQVVRQQLDGAEYYVRQMMVEDTQGDSPQYTNFVTKVHEHAKIYNEHSSWF